MRKLPVLLVVSTALSAFAAQGTQVSYRSGSDTVRAMLYRPTGKGLFPAIVVIHEFWGLNEWVEQQASKLADQGYVTLAVDLYRGKATTNPDEAHELMRGLPQDRADRDLRNAVQFLKTQGYVNSRKIGAIGWCMGGGYALDLALQEPTLAADVINYGHLATDTDSLKKINAPILGIFGAQDRGIPVADVKKFEQELKRLGKKVEVVIYPDAGHAFENPNNKSGYREKDAADAWRHILVFFARTLKQ
jgi:carboxymethylenebutenolidase